MKRSRIESVETFIVSLPRETPYLGPLGPGEAVNARGYLVRAGNRTIYPASDMSVLVKVTSEDGTVGWGETYGIIAPEAVTAIVDDVLGPVLAGRDARDVVALNDECYDLMRVRGASGGYWGDAIAGIDIALWDLYGKAVGQPVSRLLGGHRRDTIPAYVSGLPRATLDERVALAREFADRGFDACKYAAAVSFDGIVEEMQALREALGAKARIAVDLHWKFSAQHALQLIDRLAAFDPYFAEAPCAPEDVEGLAEVARRSRVPVAAGEEWRSVYEALPRLERRAVAIVQPEMGHTGISQFMQIGRLAHAFHVQVMPHASIGIGIYQAASLQASAALPNLVMHEYQHSVFDRNLQYVETAMRCERGAYTLPEGPGLGIAPSAAVWQHLRSKDSSS